MKKKKEMKWKKNIFAKRTPNSTKAVYQSNSARRVESLSGRAECPPKLNCKKFFLKFLCIHLHFLLIFIPWAWIKTLQTFLVYLSVFMFHQVKSSLRKKLEQLKLMSNQIRVEVILLWQMFCFIVNSHKMYEKSKKKKYFFLFCLFISEYPKLRITKFRVFSKVCLFIPLI